MRPRRLPAWLAAIPLLLGGFEVHAAELMVGVGGALDLPIVRKDRLTRVGPGLSLFAGTLIPLSTKGQLPLFLRYTGQSTQVASSGDVPVSVVRHDFGVDTGFFTASPERVNVGYLFSTNIQYSRDSLAHNFQLGPAIDLRLAGPVHLWLSGLASFTPMELSGSTRSNTFGVLFRAEFVAAAGSSDRAPD